MLHIVAVDPDLIAWARSEARRLHQSAESNAVQHRMVRPAQARGLGAAALEFLRTHARGSSFQSAAEESFALNVADAGAGLRCTAESLDAWAQYAEEGLIDAVSDGARARAVASTDLMEQVQILISDNAVHPATAVVLAGAALEEFLRSKILENNVTFTGKPGISSYASALRTVNLISAQDVKDVAAWAGQRNEAAHGQFELLSRQRAQIMVDGINFFLQIHSV